MKTPPDSELTAEQRTDLLKKIKASRAYKRAYEDIDFMSKKDLRPIRLQLELLKPELSLRENKIRSTIVVFGSARVQAPATARRVFEEAKAAAQADPRSDALRRRLKHAQMRL